MVRRRVSLLISLLKDFIQLCSTSLSPISTFECSMHVQVLLNHNCVSLSLLGAMLVTRLVTNLPTQNSLMRQMNYDFSSHVMSLCQLYFNYNLDQQLQLGITAQLHNLYCSSSSNLNNSYQFSTLVLVSSIFNCPKSSLLVISD